MRPILGLVICVTVRALDDCIERPRQTPCLLWWNRGSLRSSAVDGQFVCAASCVTLVFRAKGCRAHFLPGISHRSG